MIRIAASLALMILGLPLAAEPPAFDLPIGCTIGETCYIQNYVDAEPGPGARDFRCNPLTYDGHKGTDFALPTTAAMEAGVSVIAAAPGTVLGIRNDMPDGGFATDPASVAGKECGNGLVIDHGGGWHSQYCHMRRGSLRVKPGDSVVTGTPLGLVGLSGKTEFPHLHFAVRHDGDTVDPFDPENTATCAAAPAQGLWHDTPPAYLPGGLLSAGFAPDIPTYDAIKTGEAAHNTLPSASGALVLWGHAFGSRPGDVMRIEFAGPGGIRFATDTPLDRPQAQFFRAAGKRRPAAGWPTGTYSGTVTFLRDGRPLGRKQATLNVTR